MKYLWFVPILTLVAVSCGNATLSRADHSPPEWDTIHIRTGSDVVQVEVEVARTPAQRATGLMERAYLAPDEGMLFVFESDRPGHASFHMANTRIPLDIAFVDNHGRIVSIMSMEPCDSAVVAFCPRYAPGTEYRFALEVNRGYFSRHGIAVGDRLIFL